MRGHGKVIVFAFISIILLSTPMLASVWKQNQAGSEYVPTGVTHLPSTISWHDDCSSTEGWISQDESAPFDPKHLIFQGGELSSSGTYFTVSSIDDPVTERAGPLFIKELEYGIPIEAIELFQAEVSFTYTSGTNGFLSLYLFDENKQKSSMLRLHDAWAASESHPESNYFTPGEAGDGTVHDEILFGSWSGYLRFWYDEATDSLQGDLDDGTPNTQTLKTSGTFDGSRVIRYIGIQWSRHPGVTYGGDDYKLLDILLEYDETKTIEPWLEGWNYKKQHIISALPGAGTNYQVKMIVNYGSGTDVDEKVYCHSGCQIDFDDIRFTDSDGITLLDFWRENYTESVNATFWVEIADSLDYDVTIFMYYGNSMCSTISNGTATFVFFDDFNDGSIDTDLWNAYGPWTEGSGVASFSISGTGGTASLPSLCTDDSWDMQNKSLVSRWKFVEKSVNREWGVSCANTIGADHTELSYFIANNGIDITYYMIYYSAYPAGDYDTYLNPGPHWVADVFHKTEYSSTPNATLKNRWILNESLIYSYNDYSFSSDPQYIFLGFYVFGYTNTLVVGNLEMEFDYVFLRNEVGSDIDHESWSICHKWMDGWNYRKSHTINGALGAGENYQVRITVNYGTGLDVGDNVYCDAKCQPDFDDIRFTDDDEITSLDYWREEYTEYENATFWVEVADNLDTDVTIQMYYGNAECSTTSNGTATFIFFDDFEDGDLDEWTSVNPSWLVDSTRVKYGSNALHYDGGGWVSIYRNLTDIPSDIMIHAWTQQDNTLRGVMWDHWYADGSTTRPMHVIDYDYNYYHDTDVDWPMNNAALSDTWDRIEIAIQMSNSTMWAWKDRDPMGSITMRQIYDWWTINSTTLKSLVFFGNDNYETWLDDVYIRKWVSLEPTHGNWSSISEELTNWNYFKEHTIHGALGAGTNYQVKIVVNYGTGFDSGNEVYCNSDCQSDFDDIRFIDDNRSTVLDYWREEYTEFQNATFWVEIQDSLDTDVTIYMYYGNSECTTTSDGPATFLFFDDFETGNFNRWDDVGTECSIETSNVYSGSYAAYLPGGGSERNLWKNISADWSTSPFMVHVAAQYLYSGNFAGSPFYWQGYSDSNVIRYGYTLYGQSLSWSYVTSEGSIVPWTSNSAYSTTVWYKMNAAMDVSNGKHYAWKNGLYMGEADVEPDGFSETMQNMTVYCVAGGSDVGRDLLVDEIFIRKWIVNEPIHGGWTQTLDDWEFQKVHRIEGAVGAGTDYQVRIQVNYGTGLDYRDNVYCGANCQPDFDDIRFTDDDGITHLDYWRESYVEYDHAIFWVEVKDSLDTDATIKMFYGNPTCETTSNGHATFIFFDDFESDTIGASPDATRWTLDGTEDSNNYVRIYTDPADSSNQVLESKESGDGIGNSAWTKKWDPIGSVAIGMKFRYDLDYKGYFAVTNETTMIVIDQLEYLGENNHQWYYNPDYSDYSGTLSSDMDTWFSWEYRVAPDGMVVFDWDTETSHIGGYVNSEYREPVGASARYGLRHGANTWWTDDVYVRKYVSSEPIQGGWSGNQINWHHDCSNTTGFVYNENWNINWMTWNIAGGTLSSDGDSVSITSIATGTGYHGPVYEYELPNTLSVRDINNFSALFEVDNSLTSYLGYQVVMLGDENRNPVLFFSFSDGWADYTQGAYGVAYVFENGTYIGYGSGYPVTWTSFEGMMNVSYTELGLLAGVAGIGQSIITGPTESDYDRVIKYVAIASARYGSDPLFPRLVDEIFLNYQYYAEVEPAQPSIDSPEDIDYEAGTSGHEITWTISNFTPTSYEVYREGGLLETDSWPGGSQLVLDIDNLSPGEFNYTAVVFGAGDIRVTDTVIIRVSDTTSPTLGHPIDITYEYGTTGHSIIWTVSDIYPSTYTVFRNGTQTESDSWTSGSIVINIDGLNIATYNFTISVLDTSLNEAIDTVLVRIVDTPAPVVSSPSDIEYEFGSSGNTISWTLSDANPNTYSISLGTDTLQTSTWSDGTVSLDIDDLDIGMYVYSIEVLDDFGNVATDTVTVTVADTTAPILSHPPDIVVDVTAPSMDITWQATDLLPLNYEIYQNGTLVSSGSWTSGENLTYTILSSLTPGSYNLTVVVWDTSGNSDTDTVIVTLQEVPSIFGGNLLVISITIGSLVVIVIISGLICRNRTEGGPASGISEYYYG